MTEQSDTTTMSGAAFQRHVGTDPEKWAKAFVAACDRDGCYEMRRDARAAYAAQWFRDAMEAATRDGSLKTLASLTPVHREVEPLTPMENTTLREMLGGLRMALAAHERGDDEHVSEIMRLQVKQLQTIVAEEVGRVTGRLVPRQEE